MTEPTLQEGALSSFAAPFSPPEEFAKVLRAGQEIDAARAAVQEALGSQDGAIALPEHFKVHDLESHQATRRRMRGNYTTRSMGEFVRYVEIYGRSYESCVFVNAQEMSARAVLNLGTPEAPGHADNIATLALQKTTAYEALLRLTNGARRQQSVAEFCEDWSQHVTMQFFGEDDAEITARQAVAAVRRLTIETARKVESDVQQLSASLSAFESVKASSKDTIPTRIYFRCNPYADLSERLFVLRMGVTSDDKGPVLTLRIQNAERHEEEMGQELAALVRQGVEDSPAGGDVPVLLGGYQRGN